MKAHGTGLTKASGPSELLAKVLLPTEVDLYWAEIRPMLARAEENSLHELTSEDIYGFLLAGHMQGFIFLRKEKVELFYAVEIISFPQYRVANVVAIAGKNLRLAARYLPSLEGWSLAMGAVAIRGFCPNPAIVRLYRQLGLPFKPVGTVIEYDLRGKLQ